MDEDANKKGGRRWVGKGIPEKRRKKPFRIREKLIG